MPTKQFLESLEPAAGESKFNKILSYAKNNLPVQSICYIKLLENGQKEVCLKNNSQELCPGVGDTKAEALAEAISLKYPS